MATKKRQQTINKRNRERAIEEKRTLKRQAKEEKREAIKAARSRSRTGSGLRTSSSATTNAAADGLKCRPGPSSWKLARRTGSTRQVARWPGWGSTAGFPGR